jgi:hypothetical protein
VNAHRQPKLEQRFVRLQIILFHAIEPVPTVVTVSLASVFDAARAEVGRVAVIVGTAVSVLAVLPMLQLL